MSAVYYFSFRSPYSWLASLKLRAFIKDIKLVPFFEPDDKTKELLNIKGGDFHYHTMSDAKHRYILKDISRLTSGMGIDHGWPLDTKPWWEPSHLAYLKAEELGVGLEFFWAVYEARWQKNIDISNPDNLQDICQGANIPKPITKQIISGWNSPEIRNAGVDSLYEIYRNDVFGVPMFMNKRKQYWGIDRLDTFIMEWVSGETPLEYGKSSIGVNYGESSLDHAGGCG